MKKYLTEDDIRKVFTDPNSLRKAIELWKEAEKRGESLIRKVINKRKKVLKERLKKEERMSEKIICKICGREVIAYQVRKPKDKNEYYVYCPHCNKEGWIGIELSPLTRMMELWGELKGGKE